VPACHVPVLSTGFNSNPLFDRKAVHLFSDLLLHDVGTGDGIEQESAAAKRNSDPITLGTALSDGLSFMDGSATTLADTIERHQGEAGATTAKFSRPLTSA